MATRKTAEDTQEQPSYYGNCPDCAGGLRDYGNSHLQLCVTCEGSGQALLQADGSVDPNSVDPDLEQTPQEAAEDDPAMNEAKAAALAAGINTDPANEFPE